jgi:beta-lactamase class A
MTRGTDRRSILGGLGALGLIGCARSESSAPKPAVVAAEAFDLSAVERANGGRLGFFAHDTGSGRRLVWRGDERFVYCSTFKIYLAAATLMRIQAGDERLDRQVAITRDDMTNHAPVTGPAIGGTLTLEVLMKGAVEVSDNPAANLLLAALGGLEPMRQFYRGLGDTTTRVDRFEPELNFLDGDKDTILPMQAAANLERLFIDPATPLSDESRALLLRWMSDAPRGPDRIKAGVPEAWRVAHKIGTGGYGPTNDIGILYPPAGAPVIIAAFYHAAADDERNAAVIAGTTRMALTALGRA